MRAFKVSVKNDEIVIEFYNKDGGSCYDYCINGDNRMDSDAKTEIKRLLRENEAMGSGGLSLKDMCIITMLFDGHTAKEAIIELRALEEKFRS